MKLIRKSSLKPTTLIILIVGVILLGIVGIYTYQQISNQNQESRESTNTQEEVPTTPATTPPSKGGQQSTPDTENETPTDGNAPTISITALNQNGETLQIRSVIQALWSEGSCSLVITKGSETVTRQAPLQALASTSTCQGFDIPTSELSPGTWNIEISATHNTTIITTDSQVTIQ